MVLIILARRKFLGYLENKEFIFLEGPECTNVDLKVEERCYLQYLLFVSQYEKNCIGVFDQVLYRHDKG